MEKPTLMKIYGNIGEIFCASHLEKNMDSFIRGDEYDLIGHSILTQKSNKQLDYQNIQEIVKLCQESNYCDFKDQEKPCKTEEFYQDNHNPKCQSFSKDTGDKKYRWYCASRNTQIVLDNYKSHKNIGTNKFVADYLIAHYFIRNHYYLEMDKNDYNEMTPLEKKKHHEYWDGHPGRLDFLAQKKSTFYCIDSKVNTSKLSLWQRIRMSWMKKQGHTCQIYNVRINNKNKIDILKYHEIQGIDKTLDQLEITLDIIDYAPDQDDEAEIITSDVNNFIEIATDGRTWF